MPFSSWPATLSGLKHGLRCPHPGAHMPKVLVHVVLADDLGATLWRPSLKFDDGSANGMGAHGHIANMRCGFKSACYGR